MASGYEERRAARQRVARAPRSGPTDRADRRVDRRKERSTYEDRVYERDDDEDDGVVWVPLNEFLPFGRRLP
jgi:hypothetical protein